MATKKVKHIPQGYRAVTPYLTVHDGNAAIEFYTKVLGAKERMRMPNPEGKIGHAELEFGDCVVMLSDEMPEMGALSPKTIGGSPVGLNVYVTNSDEVVKEAAAAGAQVLRPVEDQFYGDRGGLIQDPFGHKWFVSTHVEDVPPDEMMKRAQEFMAKQQGS